MTGDKLLEFVNNTLFKRLKEIQERKYNLDFKNSNGNRKVEHADSKEVLESITKTESHIAKLLEEIKKEI